MPLAHELAAIEAATGARKEQLMEAALVLDRVRAEYPGIDNPEQLPGPIRREALAAVAVFRGRGRGSVAPTAVVSLLMLLAGSAALVLSPLRAFRCDPTGKGLAACRVSERALGLVTLREQRVEGIASAEAGSRIETSESRDSQGRVRTHSITVEQLVLKDASGRTLWQTTESHLLGASLEGLSRDVNGLLTAEPAAPLARTHEAWPPLLFGTLFVTIGLSSSISTLGLALRNRGFVSAALHSVLYSGPFLLAALICAVGWLLAFFGSNPPSWMVSAMHLG